MRTEAFAGFDVLKLAAIQIIKLDWRRAHRIE